MVREYAPAGVRGVSFRLLHHFVFVELTNAARPANALCWL